MDEFLQEISNKIDQILEFLIINHKINLSIFIKKYPAFFWCNDTSKIKNRKIEKSKNSRKSKSSMKILRSFERSIRVATNTITRRKDNVEMLACYRIHLSRSQIRGMPCRWIWWPWNTPNGTRGDAFRRARSLTATRQISQLVEERFRVLLGSELFLGVGSRWDRSSTASSIISASSTFPRVIAVARRIDSPPPVFIPFEFYFLVSTGVEIFRVC